MTCKIIQPLIMSARFELEKTNDVEVFVDSKGKKHETIIHNHQQNNHQNGEWMTLANTGQKKVRQTRHGFTKNAGGWLPLIRN